MILVTITRKKEDHFVCESPDGKFGSATTLPGALQVTNDWLGAIKANDDVAIMIQDGMEEAVEPALNMDLLVNVDVTGQRNLWK